MMHQGLFKKRTRALEISTGEDEPGVEVRAKRKIPRRPPQMAGDRVLLYPMGGISLRHVVRLLCGHITTHAHQALGDGRCLAKLRSFNPHQIAIQVVR